jgi:hypothetical protein
MTLLERILQNPRVFQNIINEHDQQLLNYAVNTIIKHCSALYGQEVGSV